MYLLTTEKIGIIKVQDNKLKIIAYSQISLRFGIRIKDKCMQENLQNQNISLVQSQLTDNQIMNKKSQRIKIYFFILGFILLGGILYTGVNFYKKGKIVFQGRNKNLLPSPTNIKESEIKTLKKIAFLKATLDKKEAEIWTVGTDGSEETSTGIKLKNVQNFSNFNQSPDMNHVCFIDGDLEQGEEMYLFDLRKNEVKQISNSFFKATKEYDGSSLSNCRWSLDSSKFGYEVTHAPQEYTPYGVGIEKDLPPRKFNIKMGSFIYLINEGKLEKKSDELTIYDDISYGVSKPEWNQDLSGDYYFINQSSDRTRLMQRKNNQEDIIIWEGDHIIANPPPLKLSPNKNKIAFANKGGILVVFEINNPGNIKEYEQARVDGFWTKYEWLSDTEILFWQSWAGHEYKTLEDKSWYQGDLLVLDIQTGLIKKLTEDSRTFWRL